MNNPTVRLSLSITNGVNGKPQHVIAVMLVNSRSLIIPLFRFDNKLQLREHSEGYRPGLTTMVFRCVDDCVLCS